MRKIGSTKDFGVPVLASSLRFMEDVERARQMMARSFGIPAQLLRKDEAMPQTVRDLVGEAKSEIQDEFTKAKKAELKERLKEITAAEKVVTELKDSLETFLDEPIDSAVFDD